MAPTITVVMPAVELAMLGLVLAGSLPGWPYAFGRWTAEWPTYLARWWRLAEQKWWPWAPLVAGALLLAAVGLPLARRAAWRRVTAGGYAVAITPPRTVDADRWGQVWRRLSGLAAAAQGGRWRLARPPLAFEVYRHGRVLAVGLWLPAWVPYTMVAAELARAWPGCLVERIDAPTLDGGAVAGLRLAADGRHPETGWLVDDARPRPAATRPGSADPVLGGVLAALAEARRPVLLQVLVRPATRRRLAWLAAAGRRPAREQRRQGGLWAIDALVGVVQVVVRELLDWVEYLLSNGPAHSATRGAGRPPPPDAVDREAMAAARAKLADGPHLLVTVRIGAAGDRRGQARAAARSVATGYSGASARLRPVRLRQAASALRLRRARRGDWLLLSANELGVLAHLPADPALYRFVVTALHRAAPAGAARPVPERAGATSPGWRRSAWTAPPEPDTGQPDTREATGPSGDRAVAIVSFAATETDDDDEDRAMTNSQPTNPSIPEGDP